MLAFAVGGADSVVHFFFLPFDVSLSLPLRLAPSFAFAPLLPCTVSFSCTPLLSVALSLLLFLSTLRVDPLSHRGLRGFLAMNSVVPSAEVTVLALMNCAFRFRPGELVSDVSDLSSLTAGSVEEEGLGGVGVEVGGSCWKALGWDSSCWDALGWDALGWFNGCVSLPAAADVRVITGLTNSNYVAYLALNSLWPMGRLQS